MPFAPFKKKKKRGKEEKRWKEKITGEGE